MAEAVAIPLKDYLDVFPIFPIAWEVKKTGIMPLPNPGEGLVGGHCVVIIGYDDSKQAVLCRNSWGAEWGINGNFYMPYAFVADKTKAFDFWILCAGN